MNITELSVSELAENLRQRNISAVEATRACLERISATAELNNFITVCEESALADAELSDETLVNRAAPSVLCGVPVAVKDNIYTAGVKTTCASRVMFDFVPSKNSAVVNKLKAAGAVVLGKTNMDEFAMGSTNENSAFGAVKNALNPTRVAGGSSGGSANSVAAKQAFCALGSDTGGSARQPAAYCGVVGLKPTLGAVERDGLIGFAPSLDCVGLLARDCFGAAALFDVVSKHGISDKFRRDGFTGDLRGVTIGVADEFLSSPYLDGQVAETFMRAQCVLADAGAKIERVTLPSFFAGIAAYHIISSAEAARSFKNCEYISDRTELLGAEVKRRILTGEYVSSGARYDELYIKAARVRSVIKSEYCAALEKCDVLLCPTAPNIAPLIGEKIPPDVSHYNDMYAAPVSLAGLPAVSVPFGTAHGMPVGMQIIGRYNA
ncbi:MAG: aspartyl/glutamyl-tRNA amidotransferase subunit A, partial [Clostridiales bacterium]|nr:aspartyl/glutamyl-tRNA amidotransferase subunit A [Clostridiales bacterium]